MRVPSSAAVRPVRSSIPISLATHSHGFQEPPSAQRVLLPHHLLQNTVLRTAGGLAAGLNLSGQTAIITGANAGLGYESARQLLDLHLSHLIMAVRSPDKGETAAQKLREHGPHAKIEVWRLDMCSYASIQKFAEKVARELTRLDVALLNAGLVKPSFEVVKETGHEESMQVNYFSTVLLAILLMPSLRTKRAPDGRPGKLTMVNSGLSLTGKLPLNPNWPNQPILQSFDNPEHFSNTTWYNTSKTLMHLWLWKMTEFVTADDVVVNIVDPGYVKGTENVSKMPRLATLAAKSFAAVTVRTVEVGASTYVDAVAVKDKESHGQATGLDDQNQIDPDGVPQSLLALRGKASCTDGWLPRDPDNFLFA